MADKLPFFDSVFVLKVAPEVYGKHLSRIIGEPQDYTKNKESGRFPNDCDLKVLSRESQDPQ